MPVCVTENKPEIREQNTMGLEQIRNLQVISSPSVGGREIYVPVLARKLLAQEHPTWVMCRPNTLVENLALEWKVPVEPTNINWYFNPLEILAIASFIRKHRIQIIHSHWSRDLSNLLLAARLAGNVPVILTKHVYATEPKRDLFHDWVYRNTDRVIGVSQIVSGNIAQTVCIRPERIVTIYNGIELYKQWNPELTQNVDLRPEFGIPAGKPILGYVGRLNHGKGPHILLDAFARMAEEFPDWHFVLAGKAVGNSEEDYAKKLQEKVKIQGLEKRVHFIGYRIDMPAVMHTFDILAMASEFESLGMVLVEAMAMERPVIGPNTGGVPEIIRPGLCGELFEYGKVEELIYKLKPLFLNPALRIGMGKQGRQIVLRKFNLDLAARQVVDLYRVVLSEKQK